jgi:hypothetical protein
MARATSIGTHRIWRAKIPGTELFFNELVDKVDHTLDGIDAFKDTGDGSSTVALYQSWFE